MTVFLVRHANAGDRSKWTGDDRVRPLSKSGEKQAAGLVELLGDRGVERILSSPYVRCVQTVEPLARRLGLEVEHKNTLAEGVGEEDVVALVRSLAGTTAALCTHGDVIPTLLDGLIARDQLELPDDYPCAKGSTWELEQDDSGRVVRAMYLPAP